MTLHRHSRKRTLRISACIAWVGTVALTLCCGWTLGAAPARATTAATTTTAAPVPPLTVASSPHPGLTLGFGDWSAVSQSNAAVAQKWATRARNAGAQIIRLAVSWASVAPTHRPAHFNATNPASSGYAWRSIDQQVRTISAEGFQILITVETAPRWAEGSGYPGNVAPGSWKPSATAFGQFAKAIATRYDGSFKDPLNRHEVLPRIHLWQPWNEPNINLTPAWSRVDGAWVDEAAVTYRPMVDAFYAGVKAASTSNFVVLGGTAPYGNPPGSGVNRVPPITFDQDLFCLTSSDKPISRCPERVEFDALDHHPYTSGQDRYGPTWTPASPTDVSIANLPTLIGVLKVAVQHHTVLPAGQKPVWVTEVSWQTSPPQPKAQGVSLQTAGTWAVQTLHMLWADHVSVVLWAQLVDEPVGFTEGAYFNNGTPKPTVRALGFPLLVTRTGKSTVMVWGRAPTKGTVVIEVQTGKTWKPLLGISVRGGQVFEDPLSLRGAARLRGVIGGSYSLVTSAPN